MFTSVSASLWAILFITGFLPCFSNTSPILINSQENADASTFSCLFMLFITFCENISKDFPGFLTILCGLNSSFINYFSFGILKTHKKFFCYNLSHFLRRRRITFFLCISLIAKSIFSFSLLVPFPFLKAIP